MKILIFIAMSLSLSLSTSSSCLVEINPPVKKFDQKKMAPELENLRNNYGQNKTIFEDIELAALIALSFYPELSETKIVFKKRNLKTTMATRPAMKSLVKKRSKREYIILIDDKLKNNNGLLVDGVPFNALIGLIGHECAHIVDYEQMNKRQIIGLAGKYSNKKFKKHFENHTDMATIERGLGWQLYDFATYAMITSDTSEEYKAYKKENYLQAAEILELMKEDGRYAEFFE